jgi:hypothetical protein
MAVMAWETYTPKKRKFKQQSQPRATIQIVDKMSTLLINPFLVRELGINSLTQFVRLRYDKERNVIGVTFHQKKNSNSIRLGTRYVNGVNVLARTINVKHLLDDVLHSKLPNGTYTLEYQREKDILVLSLDNLVTRQLQEN